MFCGMKSYNKCSKRCLSAVTRAQNRSFIALSIMRCSKSAQKSAVRMCQLTTVVMETMQLVLSQFKNFLSLSIDN